MKKAFLITVALILMTPTMLLAKNIRYVALGDSYTIGTGATIEESWPVLITKRLQQENLPIQLIANLARNGWTTRDLIDFELPELQKLQPDFITVLIGANDCVRVVDAQTFESNIAYILDKALKTVFDPKYILVITIPDFSMTPAGKKYFSDGDAQKSILEFNKIIVKEAQSRGMRTVDLHQLSRSMGTDPSLFAADGLHPSGKGYAQWAELIALEAERLFH